MRKIWIVFILVLVIYLWGFSLLSNGRAQEPTEHEVFLPVVLGYNSGGNGSSIYIRNNSSSEALVEISYFSTVQTNSQEEVINANQTKIFTPSFSTTYGSVVIKANQDISAVVHNWYRSGEFISNALSSGINKDETYSEVYLPNLMQNAYGAYSSHLYVQNTSSVIIQQPRVELYDQGELLCVWNGPAIEAGRSFVLDMRSSIPCEAVRDKAVSARVIADGPIAAEVHQFHNTEPRFSSYKGAGKGSNKVGLPVQFNSGFGLWSSSFSVQNLSSTASLLDITLLLQPDLSYLPTICQATFPTSSFSAYSTLSDYLPQSLIPSQGGCEPDPIDVGWGGSTILEADGPIYAFITEMPDPPMTGDGEVLYGMRSLPGILNDSAKKTVILPFMPKEHVIAGEVVSASFTVQNMDDRDTFLQLAIYNQNGELVSDKCEAWHGDNKLLASQVKRCYFGAEPDSSLPSGELYSLVLTSSETRIGAIGHVVAISRNVQTMGDWELAYTGIAPKPESFDIRIWLSRYGTISSDSDFNSDGWVNSMDFGYALKNL